MTSSPSSSRRTLYERLGGVYAIAAVVNRFSDKLIENDVVGRNSSNPQLREWSRKKLHRLPGLKFMRTLWVCDITGGPFKFHSSLAARSSSSAHLDLHRQHCPFAISPAEFDEVARELKKALTYFKVPSREQKEVLAAFAAHKSEINRCFTSK